MQKQLWLIALVGLLTFGNTVYGQNSDDAREVTDNYLITNAFVVQKPGKVLSQTDILIKDGIITSVAKGIKAPYDAKVIDADSMFVYASFIDAATHAGIPKKEDGDRPSVKNPGKPPMDVAGITPQHKAADLIDYSDKSIKAMREAGYGYLHVMPRGRMMPGTSSLITTGQGSRADILIQDDLAFYAQLRSARGVFPNTVIGVMSKFRDMYKNAENTSKYKSTYDRNPKGLKRPVQAEEYSAMTAVVNKEQPVYFHAEKAKDIYRVLKLQRELGFDLVLTNVRQANKILPKLKAKNIPVILSLELPKKIEDKKEKKEEDKSDDKDKKPKKKKKEVDPEKERFDVRKKAAYDAYESQAATFANGGVKVSFSTLSAKPKDVKPNLLRMIEKGLTHDQALAALTTNPAALTGISDIAGTIETGKQANLFITDTVYFHEDAKIKYSLSDGMLYEYKEKDKKKGKSDADLSGLSGTWTYNLEIPGDETSGTMVIESDGDSYTIKLDSSDEPGDWEEAFDIESEDGEVTFKLNVDADGMALSIDSDLTFDGDNFEGTMNIQGIGEFPISGSKKTPK